MYHAWCFYNRPFNCNFLKVLVHNVEVIKHFRNPGKCSHITAKRDFQRVPAHFIFLARVLVQRTKSETDLTMPRWRLLFLAPHNLVTHLPGLVPALNSIQPPHTGCSAQRPLGEAGIRPSTREWRVGPSFPSDSIRLSAPWISFHCVSQGLQNQALILSPK